MYNMDGIWKCGKGRQILDTYRYVHTSSLSLYYDSIQMSRYLDSGLKTNVLHYYLIY